MAERSDRHVDDLREQLRALGYLDAGVGRFVLGGAAARRRPAALAAAASARIGILTGTLLGPAAAIGLRFRAPELITSTRDAIVLAAYLGVLFAAVAGVVALAAIFAGGLLARRAAAHPAFPVRARRAAAATGVLLGLGCLVYLALWWRAAFDPAASGAVTWTIAAMTLAVAISLFLGSAVTVTVLAFLARLGLAGSLTRGRPTASWRATLPLGAVALAGAVALLVATSPQAAAATAAPALTVVPTNLLVTVLAVDGVDAPTVDRLQRAGRLPAFARLLGSKATMAADEDRDPAQVWTTIATGQLPERHGIHTLETRQVAGIEGRLRPPSAAWSVLTAATDLIRLTRPSIASGDQRRIPAFWEVAARAGLRTAVVHWWATWPAPADLGLVVSDRAILRLEQGGALDGEIAPASLYEPWRAEWARRRDAARARARSVGSPGGPADARAIVQRAAELDATVASLAADPGLGPLDLLVVYLPGLDITQHALLGSQDGAGLSASATAERVALLEQYYVFLDGLLADLAPAGGGEDHLAILVTQPGRISHPTAGVLSLSMNGSAATTAQVTDVAPTVLYALGVPVAGDLAGRAALPLFGERFASAHAVRTVATYGPRHPVPRSGSGRPLDDEMIARMRSLGYVR